MSQVKDQVWCSPPSSRGFRLQGRVRDNCVLLAIFQRTLRHDANAGDLRLAWWLATEVGMAFPTSFAETTKLFELVCDHYDVELREMLAPFLADLQARPADSDSARLFPD